VYFKQILNEEAGCSSYVIASRQTGEAAVVDAALDVDPYLKLAAQRSFTIKLVIDTHIHADHVSGGRKLAAATEAEYCAYETADLLFPFRGLKDGERLHLGQLWLDVWHTPGHRPESMSLLVTNPPRGEQPSFVLTGDCLFVGDVGRPDFGGAEGAKQQYDSVHRLMQLEDFVAVFPAHFEGSCGKGMCGRPNTTIGWERRFNPLLQMDEKGFIEAASQTPARPLNMTAIVATNRGEASYEFAEPHTEGEAKHVSIAGAPAWIAAHGATVIDVREPDEYEAGHIPGAVSIPQSELALRLGDLDKSKPYLIACAGGVRSLRATHYLSWAGYDATSLDDGTAGWAEAGNPLEGDHSEPVVEEERYQHGAPMA
jgi:hydroxyacylglutathione hydrolase